MASFDEAPRSLGHADHATVAALFVGGFLGTVLRAGLADTWAPRSGGWPWATFAVNVLGAFALGYLAHRRHGRSPASPRWRAFLETGFCGGLTTFSTLQLELVGMLDARAYLLAVAYALASLACGLAAVSLARRLVAGARIAR